MAREVRIVRSYVQAAQLGAVRRGGRDWQLDGVPLVSVRSVRLGALRGRTLDLISDPEALLADVDLEQVMPCLMSTAGEYVRG